MRTPRRRRGRRCGPSRRAGRPGRRAARARSRVVASAQCASSTSTPSGCSLPQRDEQGGDRVEEPLAGPLVAHGRGLVASRARAGSGPGRSATYAGQAASAALNHVGSARGAPCAGASATGSSGTSVDRGRQEPVATNASDPGGRRRDELGLADAGLAGDQEEPGAGLEMASYGGELVASPGDPAVAVRRRRRGARRRRARAGGTRRCRRPSPRRAARARPSWAGGGRRRRSTRWCGCSRLRARGCAGSASRRGGGGRGARRGGPAGVPAGRRASGELP